LKNAGKEGELEEEWQKTAQHICANKTRTEGPVMREANNAERRNLRAKERGDVQQKEESKLQIGKR